MAYLEILDRNKAADEEQRRHLIHQSLAKTQSIKSMADKLFEYFLVYTTEWERPEMEVMDADEVMRQFWQEYAFALESRGYTVHTDFEALCGRILGKPELLQRAFDNIYANLLKYAEVRQPIEIVCRRRNKDACLCITNTISDRRNQRQSTNIGLNTCRRIMSMHNGDFQAVEEERIFKVEMKLPLIENT